MDVFDYGKGNFRKRRKGNVTSTACCTIVCCDKGILIGSKKYIDA